MSTFLAQTEAMIGTWHGVAAPNEPGRRAGTGTRRHHRRVRKASQAPWSSRMSQPASAAALQATKETAP